MIKNRFSKTLLLSIVFMLCLSFSVFAGEDGTKITINTNDSSDITAAIKAASFAANGEESEESVMVATSSTKSDVSAVELFHYDGEGSLVFKEDNFKQAKPKAAKKALSAFIDSLKDSSISADTQSDIMNRIQESDPDVSAIMLPMVFDNTKADIFTAYKWVAPFLGVVRVIFGLGSIAIILFVIASTIMDLAYIGLPMWREHQEDKTGHSGKKPFGVSYEALATVIAVEKNLSEYQNAYLMYLKRRAITYVVLSIAILWLIAGEMSGLIGWVLNLASGVVE
jgi:hypothetical protein